MSTLSCIEFRPMVTLKRHGWLPFCCEYMHYENVNDVEKRKNKWLETNRNIKIVQMSVEDYYDNNEYISKSRFRIWYHKF
jgi:hypothetical protein